MCVFNTDCDTDNALFFNFFFCYNVICMNCGVCECVRLLYKYNITLYNLIIKKNRVFVTCVCIVIIIML